MTSQNRLDAGIRHDPLHGRANSDALPCRPPSWISGPASLQGGRKCREEKGRGGMDGTMTGTDGGKGERRAQRVKGGGRGLSGACPGSAA